MKAALREVTAIGPEVTNGADQTIEDSQPYTCSVHLTGTADFLFHRWNCEAVAAKASARKGSKAKKSDDIETYVYRMDSSELAIPGEYVRQSVIHAAKFRQDPRSPRKSAMDLYKAGIVVQTELASLGLKTWSLLDQRRAVVQRNGITRVRPCVAKGWRATFELEVILPEYISRESLALALTNAGRLVGIGDFRPTYGRFFTAELR